MQTQTLLSTLRTTRPTSFTALLAFLFGSIAELRVQRKGAMDLIWGVIAVVAVVIIVGIGLIILYNVQIPNRPSLLVG